MRRGRVGQVGYAEGTDESKRNERDGWVVTVWHSKNTEKEK